MEDFLEQKFRTFQKKGWNITGARLLAVSSCIAHKKKIQARRRPADIILAFMLLGFVSIFIFINNMTILLTLVSLSLLYVVKILTTKLNLEDLLESQSRDLQKILVLQLLDFCEQRNLGNESLSDLDLSRSLLEEKTSVMMLLIIYKFVSENTKYYIV